MGLSQRRDVIIINQSDIGENRVNPTRTGVTAPPVRGTGAFAKDVAVEEGVVCVDREAFLRHDDEIGGSLVTSIGCHL